jgi:ABC-2 type transport system ATP-binding protein
MTEQNSTLLLIDSVSVSRGSFVLGPVSMSVGAGEVVAYLGPNGCGKTTLFNVVSGLILPATGAVSIDGLDNRRDEIAFKERVAFVSDSNHVYGRMTVAQAARFTSGFYARWDHAAVEVMLKELRLPATTMAKNLSKGMRTKLSLVLALGSSPDVVVADEPTSGLDVASREWFWTWVERRVEQGLGVLVSSHSYEEVEAHCDRAVMMEDGLVNGEIRLRGEQRDAARNELGRRMKEVG